ncbi:type VI secretion system protein ImpM [Erwinia piriflorinigrans CFBP 5888]|uniref:Type VI secretion system protein ImpM n=2 Tax=Erwinia piriflorinigrans TaxID=665097 RepID=V5ZAM5_9GAMM|nr:type VI secretion system protein ImpM [Erwinia piriflorinigrans CFBP 5888]
MMSETPAIGWYGKLPSAGDFLKRRFPDALFNAWSHWFQLGLLDWKQSEEQRPDSGRQFASAPVWNFVVPPLLGSRLVQMGCLLPARDSVGRQYPVCALLSYNLTHWSPQRLARAGEWYQQLGRTLLLGVRNGYSAEQLDGALLAIPVPPEPEAGDASGILQAIGYDEQEDTLGWQQAADCFNPQQYTSFWWTNRTDGYPLYTHLHSGNFTSQLFSMLFDPAEGATPGRNGLYPPMFE